MPDKKISQLTDSANLTGYELVAVVQGNVTVKTTTQDIADLGGGNNELFPNGYEFISESRDFLSTDEGKLLILETGVTISMPSEFPFLSNQIVGVNALDSNCYYQDKSGSTVQIFGINNQPNEVVVLLSEPDFNSLIPISSPVIDGKTMLKYLYDKVNARIYEAIISQTGTDAPTVVYTAKDDLDGDITFTRTDVGDYRVNSSAGLLFVEKASMQIGYYGTTYRNHISTYYEANDNYSWFLKTYDDTGTLADNAMTHITIKITVYSA